MNGLWLWKLLNRRAMLLGALILCLVGHCVPPAFADDAGHADDAPSVIGGRAVVRRGEFNPIIDGHAWFRQLEVIPIKNAPALERTLIWHIPPRTAGPYDLRGTVRSAVSLTGQLEDIAWHDNRVYFLGPIETLGNGQQGRRVSSIAALRGPGRTYEYRPARPEVLAPLPENDRLVGFAATVQGPVALTYPSLDADNPSPPRIRVLVGSAWRSVRTPWELGAEPVPIIPSRTEKSGDGQSRARVKLLSAREGFSVAIINDDAQAIDLWTAHLEPSGRQWPVDREMVTVAPLVEWTRQTLPLRGSTPGSAPAARADHVLFLAGSAQGEDAVIAIDMQQDQIVATTLRPSGPVLLARLTGFSQTPALLPMAAPGEAGAVSTLTFAWVETKKDDSGRTSQLMSLHEISGLTGRELFNGPVKDMGFLPSRQYQMLVLILVLVMVGLLVFVLRGEPQIVPIAPARTAFAEPIRRAAAAFVDYAPAAVLVAVLSGRGPMALLIPEFAVNGAEMDLASIGLAVLFTIIHCSIGEAMFGRSIGKYLMGCRVVSTAVPNSADNPSGPKLWQALVRNIIRWTVPMLALFLIFDPARRHPGDLAARTIVVVDLEEDRIGSDS